MSQKQPRRHPPEHPIKYEDVLPVAGALAEEPVTGADAVERGPAHGETHKGSPAAAMKSAADLNERSRFVGNDDVTPLAADRGVSATATDLPDPPAILDSSAVTIGEALEAAAVSQGNKPVEQSDAAAIPSAEQRATGTNAAQLRRGGGGGIGTVAEAAADANRVLMEDEDKIKLLDDAKARLPADKAVTEEDAEEVAAAEMRNNPDMVNPPGGVGASMGGSGEA